MTEVTRRRLLKSAAAGAGGLLASAHLPPALAKAMPLGVAEALLGRLDRESIEVDELTVHTPDLDDVFLALTGQPQEGQSE